MLIQGVSTRDYPGNRTSRPQFSARSCQRGFNLSIKPISSRGASADCLNDDLFFAADDDHRVMEAFVVHQAMALILLGEAFNGVELVLMNAFVEISRDPDRERAGAAGEDIDPEFVMESVAHAEKRSTTVPGRNTSNRHGGVIILGIFRRALALPLRGIVRACSR